MVLAELRQYGYTVAFFFDEIRSIYTKKYPIWDQFHVIATSSYNYLSIADSSSVLPTLLYGTDTDKIRSLDLEPLISLNETKLSIRTMNPLTTVKEYQDYLNICYPDFYKKEVNQENSKVLHTMHYFCSGILRNISRFVTSDNVILTPHIPSNSEPSYMIFERLVEKQKYSGSMDPFNPVSISEGEAMRCIYSFNEKNNTKHSYSDLNKYFEHRIFKKTSQGHITFYSFYQYLTVSKWRPRVFVSFAWEDKEKVDQNKIFSTLENLKVEVTKAGTNCSDAANSIENNFEKWEKNHIEGENDFILISLSPFYIERINSKKILELKENIH